MRVHQFTIQPSLPEELIPLQKIAYNTWFAWNADATGLFRDLDERYWEESDNNPVKMLSLVSPKRLGALAKDAQYVSRVNHVYARFQKYLTENTWFDENFGKQEKPVIAYFSAEYGIHESLPIYSGGLGILAGDHLKSASDLGLPLVGVGLLYKQGYFRQRLNEDGVQEELYPNNEWSSIPVHLERNDNGEPIIFPVEMDSEVVFCQIWHVNVGRISLYLLDSNLPKNSPMQRAITSRLYDGERDTRLRQEILLGVGGLRALRLLGYEPQVYHLNEGHCAFMALERIRHLMSEKDLSFEEAKEFVWATNLFTTHTPVPAGNESFHVDLLRKYLEPFSRRLGFRSWEEFLALGMFEYKPEVKDFSMSILALKLSAFANGVAKLHGQVSRSMWSRLYPKLPESEVPISSITNGVHTTSWLSSSLVELFRRRLVVEPSDPNSTLNFWPEVEKVPDEELWVAHQKDKRALVRFVREHSQKKQITKQLNVDLDSKVLTIGFARRFAKYKRATLFLDDIDRLSRILFNPKKPVQIIVAGKAHPADTYAKEELIKKVVEFAQNPNFKSRIVFLEDYEIHMARYLLQGVDLWLNNPRRPLEASGTSGMKAAINGVLNFSVLDGWWDEAYQPEIGWAIGDGTVHEDEELGDKMDAESLYSTLEREIIPLFYARDAEGLPRQWIRMMKDSIITVGQHFSAHRMVMDYTKMFYSKAMKAHASLSADNFKRARDLNIWLKNFIKNWDALEVVELESPVHKALYVGKDLIVSAGVKLGGIKEEEVTVALYHGVLGGHEEITNGSWIKMEKIKNDNDISIYEATIPCQDSGRYGYSVSVRPAHPDIVGTFLPTLTKWF